MIRRTPHAAARARRRAGFTLAEVLIVLAVVAVLAGIIVPQLVRTIPKSQAAVLAQNLTAIAEAAEDFRADIGRYPDDATHLTTRPPDGATDTCGRVIGVDWDTRWKGPYLRRTVDAAGIRAGDARIATDISRFPATLAASVTALLAIHVEFVDRVVAEELERAFDGNDDLNDGAIRWVDLGGDRGVLVYFFPIRGC